MLRRQRWTPQQDSELLGDWRLYLDEEIGLRALRQKYGGRTYNAIKTRASVVGAATKRGVTKVVRTVPAARARKVPNFMLGIAGRLKGLGLKDAETDYILFGQTFKLRTPVVRELENLVGQRGEAVVKLFGKNDEIRFEKVG